MNNQAKSKLEQLKKLNLPEKAKATLGSIEKLLESEKSESNAKGEAALIKLYNQVKEIAAKQREEKTKKEVNEKTIQVKPSDVAAPEEKKQIVKVANQVDDAIDKALKNDPELANFGKSDKRRDAGRKALPAGRRVAQKGWANQFGKSDGGRVYYENRENRKDRKSPAYKAGYPYLAVGGKIHPMDDEDGTFYVNLYKTKGDQIVSVDEREYNSKASAMTYAMMKRDFMTVDESIFVMNDDGDTLYTSIGTRMMVNGGEIEIGNKFGDYLVTLYDPIKYDNLGGTLGGIVKLVNQENFDTLLIQYDNSLRGAKWFVSKNRKSYSGKNPYEVIKKLNLDKMSDGGMMADGGEVSKGYKKFGEDNSQLVNFDLSELDDYEEMQFNHFLKSFSKAESLQVLINTVEGDYSQLDERLAEIAEEQYPSEEFFENTRDYAKGGYMAEGENYEYVNTFKRFDSKVPVPQDDFEKLVDAYHKQLSGDKLAVSKYKVLKLQMGNYLGHKTVEEMEAYIEKTHNAHKMAKGGYMAKGGVLKNATYVSKRNINDIKIEINKSIKDLKGTDLLDGVYVKNNALKAKFDAYKSYNELSELNGKIWDKLKIESGSQIYASDSLQKKMAIEYQNMSLDAKFKKLTASQRKKVAEIMTDENEHSLRNYLTLRGYLGQKEYDTYASIYEPKRPYVLNPANFGQDKMRMADGGSIGFEGLSKKVAARYEGKNVKAKFQKQYGKTYDKAEAKEVGDKVAGKVYFMQQRKMAEGGKMQGYNDRLDESLSERNNKISKMNATFKARRDESKGEKKSVSKRAYRAVKTMDKMAAGGKFELPHQLDKYFTKPVGTIEVEMSKLIPIRARKEGIENAEIYMKKAYDGEMAKRKPIEIFKTRNKKYRVNDGNSTYAVAKKNGWETIYATVVSNPNVTKTGEKSTFTIAKEIRKEGESWSDAIKRVKENRK